MVSVPGDPAMRLECLTGSPLPQALRDMGYSCEATDETRERLIPIQITERLQLTSSGAYVLAADDATRRVTLRIHHPGWVRVEVFSLRAP